MTDCLFCKIVARELPANIVFEDDALIAFNDINPQAPHHVLLIPRQHVSTLNDAKPDDAALLGKLMLGAGEIARARGFADDGYRVVMNCGRNAGQSVFHVHLHLLAGRALSWPPG